MKKIILVSFYFYPCTLTPAQRINYWAINFHKLGYFPIVVTRAWAEDIKTHQDTKQPLGEQIRIEKFPTHEVHYLPYVPGILDRAYLRFGENFLRPLFLGIKVFDVILAGFSLKLTSFSNFQPYLEKLIIQEKAERMIISGEPFYLFRIGYHLSRKLGITWLADYRDDWSTNELQMERSGGMVRKWLAKLEARYEKKWVGSADSIISVSKTYTNRIAEFVKKPSVTIQNGFEEGLLELDDLPLFNKFTIAYSGVLYPSQDIRIIIDTLELALNSTNPFRLVFLGAGYDLKEKKRIEAMIPDHLKDWVEVTDRLPRAEALVFLRKCHAFLGIAYGNMKGIPSSKLYEYLALGKPVLLCPSDHDMMESILRETKLGFFARDTAEGFAQIDQIQSLYADPLELEQRKTESRLAITKYSRFHQLENFLNILH